jgi:hypothetical protein
MYPPPLPARIIRMCEGKLMMSSSSGISVVKEGREIVEVVKGGQQ